MGATKARREQLKARVDKLRNLRPPMVIAVQGRFLAPGSREYEKELKALAGSLSPEEFEGLMGTRNPLRH
jgi:hypothetical protein